MGILLELLYFFQKVSFLFHCGFFPKIAIKTTGETSGLTKP